MVIFLNPWFRVLFGPEKGWFLYTPISIMMLAGLFLIKKYPFQKSVITFCLLNIWIIIAWSDWRYWGQLFNPSIGSKLSCISFSFG